MMGMGMVFGVGDEEGVGREVGGGEDGDAVKSRERGLKLGGSRCPRTVDGTMRLLGTS